MPSDDLYEKVTIVIKTFEREEKLLGCLSSIHKNYPNVKIIIIDDSNTPLDKIKLQQLHPNLTYHHIGYNFGVSYGRNKGITYVNTKYVLQIDDDFFFSKKTNLPRLLDIIQQNDFDILGFEFYDYALFRRSFHGIYAFRPENIYALFGIYKGEHNGYKLYDFVPNAFIAKTTFLLENRWDENLKTFPEHDDFFLNIVKKNQPCKITITKEVTLNHFPSYNPHYASFRFENREHDMQYFFKKHHISKFTTVNKYKTSNPHPNRLYGRIYREILKLHTRILKFIYA